MVGIAFASPCTDRTGEPARRLLRTSTTARLSGVCSERGPALTGVERTHREIGASTCTSPHSWIYGPSMNMDPGTWARQVAGVIRAEIAARRLTDAALAEVLGVTEPTVRKRLDG